MKPNFASDNYACAHPNILEAIAACNKDPAPAYGYDSYTAQAEGVFREHFGEKAQTFFVMNGTGANVVALNCMLQPYEAVICADSAHINIDECGAPEKITGCKLLTVATSDGKLRPKDIEQFLPFAGVEHAVQPKVIAITQATEYGTVYTIGEIKALADFAHQHGMYLFMDGARFANACAFLKGSAKQITVDAGVDALTFGGTKNGMLFGEAVIFFNPEFAKKAKFLRKQNLQLASKMRFISAQFLALLENDLWLKNATHANAMARHLANQINGLPQLAFTKAVESNAIFAIMPRLMIDELQKQFHFYVWREMTNEVRLMTSFETTQEEVDRFAKVLRLINPAPRAE